MKRKVIIASILAVATLGCVITIYIVSVDYWHMRARGILEREQFGPWTRFNATPPRHAPSVTDVAFIRGWMTFGYINRLFKLPNNYLQTQLAITDRKYPDITLKKTAFEQHVSESAYVENVKRVVQQYLISLQAR